MPGIRRGSPRARLNRHTAVRRLALLLSLPLACAGPAACTPAVASFDPVTVQARSIATLFWVLLVLSALLFAGICTALAYMLVRFRGRPGDPDPPPRAGHRVLEIAWTAAPLAVLAVLFIVAVGTARAVQQPGPSPVRLTVIGHQWWWEVLYPDLGVTTANELHLPVGTPVRIELQAADVLHSFWLPQFGWMRDAVPNRTNVMQASLDRSGTFEGACTQFCGVEHAWMRIRVIGQPPAEFDAWVRQQRQPEAPPDAAGQSLVAHGRQLFLASTCVSCHTVQGTAAAGRAAPDLTHLASRETIGAGVAPNTPDRLRQWVRDPKTVKPGVLMPGYPFSDDDLAAIAAYLGSLK